MGKDWRHRRDPQPERAYATPYPRPEVKYDNTDIATCQTRWAEVHLAGPLHRRILGDLGVDDPRVFSLGLEPDDVGCGHTVETPDRFGFGRCTHCHGRFWSMAWVADGLYSDDTVTFAEQTLAHVLSRMPGLRLA